MLTGKSLAAEEISSDGVAASETTESFAAEASKEREQYITRPFEGALTLDEPLSETIVSTGDADARPQHDLPTHEEAARHPDDCKLRGRQVLGLVGTVSDLRAHLEVAAAGDQHLDPGGDSDDRHDFLFGVPHQRLRCSGHHGELSTAGLQLVGPSHPGRCCRRCASSATAARR